MPFDDAIEYMIERERDTAERMQQLKRPTWSTTKAGSFAALIQKFDSSKENEEWNKLVNGAKPYQGDLNLVMGWRQKIAWLCGCRIGLRRQFASTTADTLRSQCERSRYMYLQHERSRRALERLKDLQTTKRNQKITQA